MSAEDFTLPKPTPQPIKVRLTPAGITLAAGKTISIHVGGFSANFSADTQFPVTTDDWVRVLEPSTIHGQPLFEIVPEAPTEATAKTSTPAAPSKAKATSTTPPAEAQPVPDASTDSSSSTN